MEKRASFIHRSNLKIRRERERERDDRIYIPYIQEKGEKEMQNVTTPESSVARTDHRPGAPFPRSSDPAPHPSR